MRTKETLDASLAKSAGRMPLPGGQCGLSWWGCQKMAPIPAASGQSAALRQPADARIEAVALEFLDDRALLNVVADLADEGRRLIRGLRGGIRRLIGA